MNDDKHGSNAVAQRARKFRDERGHWGTHAESLCAEVERLAGITEIIHADSLARALAVAELQNEQLQTALLKRVCECGSPDRNPDAHSYNLVLGLATVVIGGSGRYGNQGCDEGRRLIAYRVYR